MYNRYKSKQRKKNTTKWIVNIVLVIAVAVVVHKYHDYIFFWKYTYNKLNERVETAVKHHDSAVRQKQLKDLCVSVQNYADNNPFSVEAHYLLGRTYFNFAYSLVDKPLHVLYDDSVLKDISQEARHYFLLSIKAMNKGLALGGRSSIDNNSRIIHAASLYFTTYYPINEIYTFAKRVSDINKVSLKNMSLYSLIAVKSGHAEEGIELVKTSGISDNKDGRLFLAASYLYGDQHSNAILEYKNILQSSKDSRIIKAVHIELGKIFYKRGVYSQSIEHLNAALSIDKLDIESKLWLGKVYSAVGNTFQARALWSEVLVLDSDNTEAKQLLGVM